MGREGGNHSTVVGSSIALLQERFRQLEKMRERRKEEMELLKLFTGSDNQEINVHTSERYEASAKLSLVQPEKMMIYDRQAPATQSPSALQDPPLSLSLNLFTDSRATYKKAPNMTDFWSLDHASAAAVSTSRTSHDKQPDVDTSLHL